MQCAVCGHKNPEGARVCSVCGTSLGFGAPGTPVSSTPGIMTGGTSGHGVGASPYNPFLTKGVRLQNGAYAVGEVLGQGGFGITYKGGDLALRRYVAIKEFFPQGCNRQGNTVWPVGSLSADDYANIKGKFIEEARTLGRFNDPGIVRVYGVFEENNTAYMVMEFLEGSTLSKRMSEVGMMGEAEALGIIQKIGAALRTVHNSGLIHRDIKPDNICLTNDGRVVLIDFGTARSFATGKTVKQTTMLTPGYAPLEQYGQQARFGSFTDIYALAATFYHALTGQVPPQATDRAAGVDLKTPRELNPKISQGVSQAIVWAMQIKAADRPQSVETFLEALRSQALVPAPLPQAPQESTVLIGSNDFPNNILQPQWGPPPVPAPGASNRQIKVQRLAENQLLTDATPADALEAVSRSMEACGVQFPSVNNSTFRVHGATGQGAESWSSTLVGQVTHDVRGTVVTLHATPAAGLWDPGRTEDEVRRLAQVVFNTLSAIPILPAPPKPSPQPRPMPGGGGASSPGPYYPTAPPMPRKQGTEVFLMGLAGLVPCCCYWGPAAWIKGNTVLKDYGGSDPGDRALVQAGRILGIVTTVMWGLYISSLLLSGMGS